MRLDHYLVPNLQWLEIPSVWAENIWASSIHKGSYSAYPDGSEVLIVKAEDGSPSFFKRTPTGTGTTKNMSGESKPTYRYHYASGSGGLGGAHFDPKQNPEHFAPGAKHAAWGGHFTIHSADPKAGTVTVSHSADKAGTQRTMPVEHFAQHIAHYHAPAIEQHKQKVMGDLAYHEEGMRHHQAHVDRLREAAKKHGYDLPSSAGSAGKDAPGTRYYASSKGIYSVDPTVTSPGPHQRNLHTTRASAEAKAATRNWPTAHAGHINKESGSQPWTPERATSGGTPPAGTPATSQAAGAPAPAKQTAPKRAKRTEAAAAKMGAPPSDTPATSQAAGAPTGPEPAPSVAPPAKGAPSAQDTGGMNFSGGAYYPTQRVEHELPRSTNLKRTTWTPEKPGSHQGTMRVHFHNGAIHDYGNVHYNDYASVVSHPTSHGEAFNERIKGAHPHMQVRPATPEGKKHAADIAAEARKAWQEAKEGKVNEQRKAEGKIAEPTPAPAPAAMSEAPQPQAPQPEAPQAQPEAPQAQPAAPAPAAPPEPPVAAGSPPEIETFDPNEFQAPKPTPGAPVPAGNITIQRPRAPRVSPAENPGTIASPFGTDEFMNRPVAVPGRQPAPADIRVPLKSTPGFTPAQAPQQQPPTDPRARAGDPWTQSGADYPRAPRLGQTVDIAGSQQRAQDALSARAKQQQAYRVTEDERAQAQSMFAPPSQSQQPTEPPAASVPLMGGTEWSNQQRAEQEARDSRTAQLREKTRALAESPLGIAARAKRAQTPMRPASTSAPAGDGPPQPKTPRLDAAMSRMQDSDSPAPPPAGPTQETPPESQSGAPTPPAEVGRFQAKIPPLPPGADPSAPTRKTERPQEPRPGDAFQAKIPPMPEGPGPNATTRKVDRPTPAPTKLDEVADQAMEPVAPARAAKEVDASAATRRQSKTPRLDAAVQSAKAAPETKAEAPSKTPRLDEAVQAAEAAAQQPESPAKDEPEPEPQKAEAPPAKAEAQPPEPDHSEALQPEKAELGKVGGDLPSMRNRVRTWLGALQNPELSADSKAKARQNLDTYVKNNAHVLAGNEPGTKKLAAAHKAITDAFDQSGKQPAAAKPKDEPQEKQAAEPKAPSQEPSANPEDPYTRAQKLYGLEDSDISAVKKRAGAAVDRAHSGGKHAEAAELLKQALQTHLAQKKNSSPSAMKKWMTEREKESAGEQKEKKPKAAKKQA